MLDKSVLRSQFRSKLFQFKPEKQMILDLKNHLFSFINQYVKPHSTISIYYSKKEEASTHYVLDNTDFEWAFPRIKKENLFFYKINHKDQLEKGPFDLKEPLEKGEEISLKKCPLVVVPGLAFNIFGERLGRGGGFFDRALSCFKGLKVGLCYSFQVCKEQLNFKPHDVLMDFIITERYILKNFDQGVTR